MAEEVGIVMTLYDRVSPTLKSLSLIHICV